MNKSMVMDFYKAYGHEPTEETEQVINDMLAVWGRLEKFASKNPALLRKGIIFGMGLAEELKSGGITPRAKTAKKEDWNL